MSRQTVGLSFSREASSSSCWKSSTIIDRFHHIYNHERQQRSFGSKKSGKVKAAIAASTKNSKPLSTPPAPSSDESSLSPATTSTEKLQEQQQNQQNPTTSFGKSSSQSLVTPSLVRTDLSDQLTWRREMAFTDFNSPHKHASFINPSSTAPPDDWETKLVDFKDLFDPELHMATVPKSWKGYEMATPLFDDLMKTILIKGKALTVADYMQQVLTNPDHGYYRNEHQRQNDVKWDDDDDVEWDDDNATLQEKQQRRSMIGPKGDFVTAPEISQIFGESIAVWFITQWKAVLFRTLRLRLIELGPGKGTLMHDIIRAANALEKGFFKSIREIHFVEQSASLREMQKEMLQTIDFVQWEFHEPENESKSTTTTWGSETQSSTAAKKETTTETPVPDGSSTSSASAPIFYPIIKVKWHNYFTDVISDVKESDISNPKMANLMLAQEFFDALPIHVFVKTPDGWRERLVDLAALADDVDTVDSDGAVAPSSDSVPTEPPKRSSPSSSSSSSLKPRFRFVTAPDVTPALTTLLRVDPQSGKSLDPAFDAEPEGQVLEVCPEGILLVQDMAQLIQEHGGGCALLIDYGQVGSTDSLRGYSQHEQVNPLTRPGLIDVTADVDFGALRHAVNNRRPNTPVASSEPSRQETQEEKTAEQLSFEEEFSDFLYEDDEITTEQNDDKQEENASNISTASDPLKPIAYHGAITAFGPITQGKFLASMGAVDRIYRFIENDTTSEEEANLAYQALEKLAAPDQMGERFKVLAISVKKEGIFEPAGFDTVDAAK